VAVVANEGMRSGTQREQRRSERNKFVHDLVVLFSSCLTAASYWSWVLTVHVVRHRSGSVQALSPTQQS
jgi:hypothetical protein